MLCFLPFYWSIWISKIFFSTSTQIIRVNAGNAFECHYLREENIVSILQFKQTPWTKFFGRSGSYFKILRIRSNLFMFYNQNDNQTNSYQFRFDLFSYKAFRNKRLRFEPVQTPTTTSWKQKNIVTQKINKSNEQNE